MILHPDKIARHAITSIITCLLTASVGLARSGGAGGHSSSHGYSSYHSSSYSTSSGSGRGHRSKWHTSHRASSDDNSTSSDDYTTTGYSSQDGNAGTDNSYSNASGYNSGSTTYTADNSTTDSSNGKKHNSGMVILIYLGILGFIGYRWVKKQQGKAPVVSNAGEEYQMPVGGIPFPEGLDSDKISRSFLAIQDAWQKKDLRHVRKWLSDGMYQRFTAQFKMMNALSQINTLNNIHINSIQVNSLNEDGCYKTAEIAISFTLDDKFVSNRFPQLNEFYPADTDTEYWTFIKRTDAQNKDIYDNNNCPNCGAALELEGGEVNRCANCNTLINSATYDWVLCEVTQDEEYSDGLTLSGDPVLKQLMQHDPLFSVQRMEDIASNIFMQIMEVFTGSDEKRLSRFADAPIAQLILQQKHTTKPFIFDRLYLNAVTLSGYAVENDLAKLYFDLYATYRRVNIEGRLQMIDNECITVHYRMELSRSKDFSGKPNDTAFSYECSSCGAPFTDTTNDCCGYCGAPILDKKRDWVLTGFTLYETLASPEVNFL